MVIFLLRLDNLASKSVFVIKFTCANLALETSVESLLNSGVVIYLLWLWSVSFFSISVFLCYNLFFLTKLLTIGILFPTVINAAFVAKLLILGIWPSISVILALWSVSLTRPQVSGIFSYTVFLTT